jgi:hypothetical protein
MGHTGRVALSIDLPRINRVYEGERGLRVLGWYMMIKGDDIWRVTVWR